MGTTIEVPLFNTSLMEQEKAERATKMAVAMEDGP